MKNKLVLAAALSFSALFAFKNIPEGAVTGKVIPADGMEQVWAINGTDSTKASTSKGEFKLILKPGDYKIVIDATEKYEDMVIEQISVAEARTTLLGNINLKKKSN